ncbi:hypothetical protein GBAR_LOCUS21780 [Geodia barretti]|uniref:Uncharacterized protein n=1 Tax=Geodia barretti TaxID=519541 RepID=A0AA35X021_GEOBA|nr:hypothetical protein GBAR_LOCUS21780 [Geodia barretti]
MFTVASHSIPAARPEDFSTAQVDVRYDPVRNKACAQLVVVDFPGAELPESLCVQIELKDDHSAIQISNTQNYGIIEIMDDDIAGIGLERTVYTMSSTAETVEVCLYVSRPAISCPITFPFDIFFNLTTSAGVFEVDTTQELSQGDGVDEEGRGLYKLLFDACQKRFCFDISRRDVTSGVRGRFEMTVTRTPDHGRTTEIVPNRGYIEIR